MQHYIFTNGLPHRWDSAWKIIDQFLYLSHHMARAFYRKPNAVLSTVNIGTLIGCVFVFESLFAPGDSLLLVICCELLSYSGY